MQTTLPFRFSSLRELLLANNRLTTIANQGLSDLPSLTTLDIRFNELRSLVETVKALSKCAKLTALRMQVRCSHMW